MTDQAQAAASQAAPQQIPMSEAVARYSASKAAAKSGDGKPNDVSEAARKLGQHAAQARQARQAQAAAQTQEPADEAGEQQVEDEPQESDTQDDTANAASPTEAEADTEGEPEEAQTIDLGDGVKVTLDEVRDGFMLKADHTRKTQALASERKEFETKRTQRLTELDEKLGMIQRIIPQPKSLDVWVEEMGSDEGIKAFARQNAAFENLAKISRAIEQEKGQSRIERENERDSHLAENYNKEWADPAKREKAYTELSAYALQLGATPESLRDRPVEAWMLKALDGSRKNDAIQANKGNVTKLVAGKPKVVKPGARVSQQSATQTTIQNGYAKLKSSGNVADAVALMRAIRGGKRG